MSTRNVDSNLVGIERAVLALIEQVRQAAYDDGYEDASSVAPVACGCPSQQLGQQGDLV